jgi:hypothetical protein
MSPTHLRACSNTHRGILEKILYEGAGQRRSGGGPGLGYTRTPVGIPSLPRDGRWKPRRCAMLGAVGSYEG